MKNIFVIITCLLTASLLSCKKSFIERFPTATVSVDVLYKTDKDFQDAVTGCYNILQTQYQSFWVFGDLPADDIEEDIPNHTEHTAFEQFTVNDKTALLESTWSNYYSLINRANNILTKIADKDAAVVTNKDRHIGEAKFMRAMAYFDLVRIYGDVPIVTASLTPAQAYKAGREKTDKIYTDIIIKDLQDAEAKLPLKYTGADVGRITKGAARAMLGKVYLTRKDFANAETKLQEVTTMGYALLPNYKDLYDYTKNEHHSEYIFDIEYEEGIQEGSNFTHGFVPAWVTLTDFFGIKGGQAQSDGASTPGFYAAFDPADIRRNINVQFGITINGVYMPIPTTTIQASKSYSLKYVTPVASANDSRANWKVIRYADVLLMYAEALNENGKTAQALTTITPIRTRAGLAAYSGLTKDDAREKIYLERRLELCLEGQRWFDLVRTGRALATMQSSGMKAHQTVFPIPLSQIQIINNPSIFPQNTGY